jgi:hypothetical protein
MEVAIHRNAVFIDGRIAAGTVVPDCSHYNFITSPEVPQIVAKFLADPAHQCAGRRSSCFAGLAGAGKEAIGVTRTLGSTSVRSGAARAWAVRR